MADMELAELSDGTGSNADGNAPRSVRELEAVYDIPVTVSAVTSTASNWAIAWSFFFSWASAIARASVSKAIVPVPRMSTGTVEARQIASTRSSAIPTRF
jgi:hypothetical protein